MSATYTVSFLAMGSTTLDAGDLAKKIRQMLDDMNQEIQQTLGTWLGPAKLEYEAAWKKANAICDAMPASLAQVSSTLDQINQGFSQAEQNVVNTFTS